MRSVCREASGAEGTRVSDLSDLSGIERALFSTPYQIPIRRKEAVLVLLKKRVDAKSDAAAHVPPSLQTIFLP